MENLPPQASFKRGVVQPTVCLKECWDLIKDKYWLLVGMSLVAMLLGSMVPFGIILGPLMCGIYITLFQIRRGHAIEFGLLFKGFDYFGESIVATLIHYVPMVAIILPFYIVMYAGLFLMMPRGGEPDPSSLFGFMAVLIVMMLVMMVLITIISVLFTFSYPLIVDRKLSGLEAVKLSAKAGLANFWSLLGLLLLNGLLVILGALLCYVGMFLVFPVTFAAISVAYEKVFGLGQAKAPDLPPPPPSFT
jgi:hypothetical protein